VSRQTIFDLEKSLTKKWDTLLRIFRNTKICKFAGLFKPSGTRNWVWLGSAIFTGSNRAVLSFFANLIVGVSLGDSIYSAYLQAIFNYDENHNQTS